MKRRASKARGKRKNLRETILIILGMVLIIFFVFSVTRAIVMKGVQKYNKNMEIKTNLIVKTPETDKEVVKKFNTPIASNKKEEVVPIKRPTPKPTPIPIKKKTPVPVTKPITSQSVSRYYIQIGAFKSESNAKSLAAKARSLGYKNVTYTKENNLYKVRIYGFPSRDKALFELEKLKKKGFEGFVGKK